MKQAPEFERKQDSQDTAPEASELASMPDFHEVVAQHEAVAERRKFAKIGQKVLAAGEQQLDREAITQEMAAAGIELDDKMQEKIDKTFDGKVDAYQLWDLLKQWRQISATQGEEAGSKARINQLDQWARQENGAIDCDKRSHMYNFVHRWKNQMAFGAEIARNPEMKFYLSTDLPTALNLLRDSGLDCIPDGVNFSKDDDKIQSEAFHLSYDQTQPDGRISNGFNENRYAVSSDITFIFPGDLARARYVDGGAETPSLTSIDFTKRSEYPIGIVINDPAAREELIQAIQQNPNIPNIPILNNDQGQWSNAEATPPASRLREAQNNLPGNKEFFEQRELQWRVFEDVDTEQADSLTETYAERFGERQMSHIRELCSQLSFSEKTQNPQEFEQSRNMICQLIGNELGNMLGLDPIPAVCSENKPHEKYGGYHSGSKGIIMINWAHVSARSHEELVGVIAHEIWHGWQYQQTLTADPSVDPENAQTDGERNARFYRYNLDHYADIVGAGRSYHRYRTQLIEYEAYHFEEVIERKMQGYLQGNPLDDVEDVSDDNRKTSPFSKLRNLFARRKK